MDPSKPNEPTVDQGRSIPRSRPGEGEVLEGEIIGKNEPLGRPGAVPPSPPPRPSKGLGLRKSLLLVVIGVAAFMCLGGGVTWYALYDKATTPERGTPAVSLQQYLTAKFDRRDELSAARFVCSNSELSRIDALFAQIKDREAQTGMGFQIILSDLVVFEDGDSAKIEANLNVVTTEADGASSRSIQQWSFTLNDSDGWRVCGATRVS